MLEKERSSCGIQNSQLNVRMKNLKLGFVPSSEERSLFRRHIQSHTHTNTSSEESRPHTQPEQDPPSDRKLTHEELQSLIQRLTCSRQENVIKQQIKKIQLQNYEWEQTKQQNRRSKHNHEVEERLIEQGKKRQEKIEHLQRVKEQEEMKEVRERPVITDRFLGGYRPLKQRIGEIVTNREDKVARLEAENKPSFNPTINRYSAFIAEIKNENDGNVVNRLNNNDKVEQKLQLMKGQVEQSRRKELTFQPKINSKSRVMAQKSRTNKTHYPPNIPTGSTEGVPNEFVPKICQKSTELLRRGKSGSFVERLEKDNRSRKLKELELSNLRDNQYHFQPKINPKSRELASSRRTIQCRDSFFSHDSEESLFEEKPQPPLTKFRSIPKEPPVFNNISNHKNRAKLMQLFGSKYSTLNE